MAQSRNPSVEIRTEAIMEVYSDLLKEKPDLLVEAVVAVYVREALEVCKKGQEAQVKALLSKGGDIDSFLSLCGYRK
tara:strand:- start:13688 stop:13918 length:231 start_codon:yes stop_codon:yes gene_type:complete